MPNSAVVERLVGVQEILIGVRKAGQPMSAATRGREREQFVESFLAKVFPLPFRFGSGDITDTEGHRSGQLDVVVEYPFLPSLPIPSAGPERLYLAEGVAAAIEVKSDVASQWGEVERTARQLAGLRRKFGSTFSMGEPPGERVPFFAAGFSGWQRADAMKQRLADGMVDGILVIDPGLFVSSKSCLGIEATGPWALWGLVSCLHQATSVLRSCSAHPLAYALP
jgi:hypothetical protein